MAATRDAHGRESSDPPAGVVREEVLRLGDEDHLVGILCAAPQPRAAAPAVIILNAGVLHRIGPHRLHVKLARRLAASGFTSLRLDLSGIGDSRGVPGDLTFRQSSVADARAAMDGVQQHLGTREFVLFGICSGADNGLATALADPRVVGLVLVDPPAYATRPARARALLGRVRALDGARAVVRWGVRAMTRRARAGLSAIQRAPRDRPAVEEGASEGRETPPLAELAGWLRTLLGRRVAIFAIYSGALGIRYNQVDQLFESLPELRGRVDHAYFPDANHTFTELAMQASLLASVTGWFERAYR